MLNKYYLIIGSSSGFGRVLTEFLISKGEQVIATVRDLTTVPFKASKQLIYKNVDLFNKKSITNFLNDLKNENYQIKGVIHNAGVIHFGNILNTPIERFREIFQINLFGHLEILINIFPNLAKNNGNIIFVSSDDGLVSSAGTVSYSMTKFAMEALAEGLSDEITNIAKVYLIEPGYFKTKIYQNSKFVGSINTGIDEIDRNNKLLEETTLDRITEEKLSEGELQTYDNFLTAVNKILFENPEDLRWLISTKEETKNLIANLMDRIFLINKNALNPLSSEELLGLVEFSQHL